MKKLFVVAALIAVVATGCESKPTDFVISKGGSTNVTVRCV